MFTYHINRIRRTFIVGVIAALLLALPSSLFAQSSPLTVQPSTGRVGIGTTTPRAKLDLGSSGGSMFVLNPGSATGPTYSGFAHHDLIMGSYLSGGYSQGFISTGYMTDGNRKFHIGSGSNGAFDGTTSFVPAFTVTSGGNVGVGTTNPGNILTVQQNSATDPIADAWTTYSSRRWKTNIEPLQHALEKLLRLRGVSFDWKANGKRDIGLIAEEVGEVVPEVVAYEENSIDAKSVDYARLVAVLIEAVKEQQTQIEQLKAEVEGLAGKIRLADRTQIAR